MMNTTDLGYSLVMVNRMWNNPDAALREWERHYTTLAWVRASCEVDHLPDWLTEMVVQNIRWQMLAPDFPHAADSAV